MPQTAPGPTRIRFYLDADGTLYPDLAAYKLACYPIPELNYFPAAIDRATGRRSRFDLDSLNERFIHAQRQSTLDGGNPSGPDVCNSVLIDMAQRGELAGLNNEVLRAVGKKIRLLPGVIDFMKDARHLVEELSRDKHTRTSAMTVDFAIVSAGLHESTISTQLGDLMDGENPLVAFVTGQRFLERPTVIEVLDPQTGDTKHIETMQIWGVERSMTGADKRDILAQDLERGIVSHEHQIAIGDGLTDGPMFFEATRPDEHAKRGHAIIVCEAQPHNPKHHAKHRTMREFIRHNPEMSGVFNANWSEQVGSEVGQLYRNLFDVLEEMVWSNLRKTTETRMVTPPGRAGQPATYVDLHGNPVHQRELIQLATPGRRALYFEAPLARHNANIAMEQNPQLEKVLRTFAQFGVRACIHPTTSRELLRGEVPTQIKVIVADADKKTFALPGAVEQLTGIEHEEVLLPSTNRVGVFELRDGGTLKIEMRPTQFKDVIKSMRQQVVAGQMAGVQVNGTLYPLFHELSRPLERTVSRHLASDARAAGLTGPALSLVG